MRITKRELAAFRRKNKRLLAAKRQSYFTVREREILKTLWEMGLSHLEISALLGRDHTTVFKTSKRLHLPPQRQRTNVSRVTLSTDHYKKLYDAIQEHPEWHNRKMAQECDVSVFTISKYRNNINLLKSKLT